MAENTLLRTAFRAQFDVAWPIWAGGYPTQEVALDTLGQCEADLRFAVEQRMKQLLGVKFELATFNYQGSGYRPISNLWPSTHPPNSVSIFVEVEAPEEFLIPSESLEDLCSPSVEDIAGLITTFFRDRMPGASAGADIYDVETRWDPALSAPSRVEAVEPPSSVLDRPASVSQTEDNRKGGSEIFISYSRRDAKSLTDVQTYLRPLRIYSKIEIWDDTRITPGSPWRTEIKDAIERAEVFILLISAHFVASEFIAKNELPPLLKAAEQQGKLVIPLILNHTFLAAVPELAEFQSLNAPSKPLLGMSKVGRAKVLKQLAETVHAHFSRLA
jgi:hypothetical protein